MNDSASRKKRAGFIVLLLAVVLAVLFWRFSPASQPVAAQQSPGRGAGLARAVTVEVGEVTTGPIQERAFITGSLKPKEAVDVMPQATGRVQRILVDVGDILRAGQLIAEMEDDELAQQVNRAKASLAVTEASARQRQAELANAEAELKRASELVEGGLISRQDYDARRTNYQVIQAQIQLADAQTEEARANLRELEIRASQTKVYSPMNGQVAARHIDTGALITPATPIIRVVNISTLVTEANVPEQDVAKLRVGTEAIVHVDGFDSRRFVGRVARISPVLDPATRSAFIQIEIPNPDNRLRAEMFVRVDLDLASTRTTTLIPRDALVYRGQQPGIYVVRGDAPEFRQIEAGLMQGDQVEILSNLKPGTQIVTRGASMIREGDRIRVLGNERPS